MTDGDTRLGLRGIELEVRIGVTEAERAEPRLIIVDVEMTPRSVTGSRTDELEGTVDYAAVTEVVRRRATDGEYRLIERLATVLRDALWQEFALSDLEVSVRKPAPPVAATVADAWVRVSRTE